jgi:hypothetical protein
VAARLSRALFMLDASLTVLATRSTMPPSMRFVKMPSEGRAAQRFTFSIPAVYIEIPIKTVILDPGGRRPTPKMRRMKVTSALLVVLIMAVNKMVHSS